MAETWSWIDAAGTAWPMNLFAQGMEVMEGVTGRGIPPVRRVRHVVAGQPGQVLDDVKHDLRTLSVPVLLKASTEATRTALIRAWSYRFDPARGTGILDLTAADGDERLLSAIYAGGLELTEDADRYPGCQAAVITFEADDPYFYDTATQQQAFVSSGVPSTWFTSTSKKLLPVSLGSSSVLGSASVAVSSDVDTWPTWTIVGPGTNLIITNETTGRSLLWGGTLLAGQQLIIDTHPGIKTVLSDTDVNLFGGLTAWDFWPLVPGTNALTVDMSGTDSSSAITVGWVDRFLTA